MNFASDNSGPSHPLVMEALIKANEGYAASYGSDEIMDRVRAQIRDLFEAPEAAVYLVQTGTAANALALATIADPWSAIYCHRHAHIEEDECNAPEFFTGGAKLHLLEGDNAKISLDALTAALKSSTDSFVHNAQRGALSLTNVTEKGAVYSVAEVTALAACAKDYGLPVHMDGARFANALVSTNASAAEMTWRAGVDVLSFGGTKNGLPGVEAVIFFDPKHAWEFELRRKRAGHLVSKHRYLSAQMEAYLTDGLWLQMARSANQAADKLRHAIGAAGAEIILGSDANMTFATMARRDHQRLMKGGARYYLWGEDTGLDGPPDAPLGCRLVANWSTTDAEIGAFAELLKG